MYVRIADTGIRECGATYVAHSRFSPADGLSQLRVVSGRAGGEAHLNFAREGGDTVGEQAWERRDCPVPACGELFAEGPGIVLAIGKSYGSNMFASPDALAQKVLVTVGIPTECADPGGRACAIARRVTQNYARHVYADLGGEYDDHDAMAADILFGNRYAHNEAEGIMIHEDIIHDDDIAEHKIDDIGESRVRGFDMQADTRRERVVAGIPGEEPADVPARDDVATPAPDELGAGHV